MHEVRKKESDMTQEEFFAAENKRNEVNALAYREHMVKQRELMERQVQAQEEMVKYLAEVVKNVAQENQ